jgi:hypothetical protein
MAKAANQRLDLSLHGIELFTKAATTSRIATLAFWPRPPRPTSTRYWLL